MVCNVKVYSLKIGVIFILSSVSKQTINFKKNSFITVTTLQLTVRKQIQGVCKCFLNYVTLEPQFNVIACPFEHWGSISKLCICFVNIK